MFPMLLQLITHEDGYYALTKSGNVVLIALVALLVIVAILAMTRKDKDTDLRTIRITVSAISLALAFVTSFFRLFELPWAVPSRSSACSSSASSATCTDRQPV